MTQEEYDKRINMLDAGDYIHVLSVNGGYEVCKIVDKRDDARYKYIFTVLRGRRRGRRRLEKVIPVRVVSDDNIKLNR